MEKFSGQRVERLDIKSLRSDNGGEYTSKEFDTFCKNRGIHRQFSNPYTPEQNGVSERFNRTMIESARSMLYHAKLPLEFWAEAVNTAVYIRNRSPTTSLNYGTPYECWFGSKPDVSHMRVFGSQCFVHIPDDQRRKLDAKSYRGIFVGYPEGTKGYKIYNVASGKFTRTRNVVFDENNFHNFDQPAPKKAEIMNVVLPIDDDFEDILTEVANLNIDNSVRQNVLPAQVDDQVVQDEIVVQPPLQQQQTVVPLNLPQTTPPTVAPTYEETFMNQVHGIGPSRSRKPTRRYLESDECNFSELPVDADAVDVPKTYKSALNNHHKTQWHEAMQKEYSSLTQKKTWRLVPRPTDKNIVKNKWVYNLKRNEKGEIDRFKARLVAKGYTQTEGVDYDEIFSPVAKFQSIRSLLALANAYDLDVHHMDVTTAFLNGDLDCEIYMEQPEGFIDPDHPDYVCLLDKSLYGLKQSSRCWNNTLDSYLKENDYRQSPADECIYVKTVRGDDGKLKFVILGVYVDDIIPVSNNTEFMLAEKAKICNQYEMVDNGEISYCLGLAIKRDRERKIITISQPSYLEDVLDRFGMKNCKPVATPLEPGVKYFATTEDDELCDVRTYQKAIGSLTYAAICTRPDISAAVGVLSQFMSNPNTTHWTGVKRILRYLRGTTHYGLVYDGNQNNELYGYSDADWAGDLNTRRSTSGYVFRFGNATISWRSKKQATVAKSSTEAEYVALSTSTQEVIWLRRLFASLGVADDAATTIYEDNQGALELSRNPKHHDRTKHIDVCHHFVRERVATNEIDVVYCSTNDMTADIMTKGLGAVKFVKFREGLGVWNVDDVLKTT